MGRAYRLQPDNLFLLVQHLSALARTRDASIAAILDAAQASLAPLRAGVKLRTRVDLEDLRADARRAVETGNWGGAARAVNGIRNLVVSTDAARSDLVRIDPHPLEYLRHEFEAAFYQRHPSPVPARTGQCGVVARWFALRPRATFADSQTGSS